MKFSMARTLALALAAVAILASTPRARADLIVSSLTSTRNDFWNLDPGDGAAAYSRFSLASAVSVTSATALIQYTVAGPASDWTVGILGDNAGTPGATVYGTGTAAAVSLPATYSPVDFSFGTAVDLSPGTYWIKLSTTVSGKGIAWGATTSVTNTGSGGSVLAGLYYNGTSNFDSSEAYLFSLTGVPTVAAVPEPGVLGKVGLASIIGVASAVRRVRRRRDA